MSTKSSLLKLLSDNAGTYISGEKIGESLGVSRTAVNKACAALPLPLRERFLLNLFEHDVNRLPAKPTNTFLAAEAHQC